MPVEELNLERALVRSSGSMRGMKLLDLFRKKALESNVTSIVDERPTRFRGAIVITIMIIKALLTSRSGLALTSSVAIQKRPISTKLGHTALTDNHDYDGAIVDYTKAIELRPNDAITFGDRGLAYYAKKRSDRTI